MLASRSQGYLGGCQLPPPRPSAHRTSPSREVSPIRSDPWSENPNPAQISPTAALLSLSLGAQREHKRLRDHWGALERDNRKMEDLLSSWQKAYRDLEERHRETCKTLQARLEEVQKKMQVEKQNHLEEHCRLRQENDTLRDQNALLRRRQLDATKQSAIVYRQNHSLQEMLIRAQDQLAVGEKKGVEEQMQALADMVSGLERSKELMESELDDLRVAHAEAQHRNKLLEMQLGRQEATGDAKSFDFQEALKRVEAQNSQLEAELARVKQASNPPSMASFDQGKIQETHDTPSSATTNGASSRTAEDDSPSTEEKYSPLSMSGQKEPSLLSSMSSNDPPALSASSNSLPPSPVFGDGCRATPSFGLPGAPAYASEWRGGFGFAPDTVSQNLPFPQLSVEDSTSPDQQELAARRQAADVVDRRWQKGQSLAKPVLQAVMTPQFH